MGRNPQYPHITPSREPLFPHVLRGSIETIEPKLTNWQRAVKEAQDRIDNEEEWVMFPNRETEQNVNIIIHDTAQKYHVPEDILRKQVLWQIKETPEVRQRGRLTDDEINRLIAEVKYIPKETEVPKEYGKSFLSLTKEATKTSHPWKVAYIYEKDNKEYAYHETSREKALARIKEKFGDEIHQEVLLSLKRRK
jgi:hypothetical protein